VPRYYTPEGWRKQDLPFLPASTQWLTPEAAKAADAMAAVDYFESPNRDDAAAAARDWTLRHHKGTLLSPTMRDVTMYLGLTMRFMANIP
jgi:hypothetical protein